MALPWGRRVLGFPANALESNHLLIGTFAAKKKNLMFWMSGYTELLRFLLKTILIVCS